MISLWIVPGILSNRSLLVNKKEHHMTALVPLVTIWLIHNKWHNSCVSFMYQKSKKQVPLICNKGSTPTLVNKSETWCIYTWLHRLKNKRVQAIHQPRAFFFFLDFFVSCYKDDNCKECFIRLFNQAFINWRFRQVSIQLLVKN